MQRLLRFTLDLFDPSDLPPQPPQHPARAKWPETPQEPEKSPFSKQKGPEALVPESFPAIKEGAFGSTPAARTADLLAPPLTSAPAYCHPRANRQANLNGAVVRYEFRRARRKTIGFSIRPDGLVVAAPGWVPIAQVESALQEKAAWIVRKLNESRERAELAESERIVWCDGAIVPLLGRPLIVRIEPGLGRRHAAQLLGVDDRPAACAEDARSLRIALAANPAPERIRDAVQAFLLAEARRRFTERLDHFAPRLAVRWTKLRLSNADTRWGCASESGSIRLHWRLIQMEPALLDYVVVHELAHLRHMDHSRRFWKVVESVLPDHAGLRRQLKGTTLPRWS